MLLLMASEPSDPSSNRSPRLQTDAHAGADEQTSPARRRREPAPQAQEPEAIGDLEHTMHSGDSSRQQARGLARSIVDGLELKGSMSVTGGMRATPVKVGRVDAAFLRGNIAASLFGKEAEPVRIGRFTILSRIGSGGMGVVYSAYDEQLDRKVALKLLQGHNDDDAHSNRLMREAQALARVSHPNVVQIYEVGTFRSQVFLAMEFVQGKTLGSLVSELRENRGLADKARTQRILDLFLSAGRGLAAAHAKNIIHRDFKPDNVLVSTDGEVKVVDFGLARSGADRTPTIEEDENPDRVDQTAENSLGTTAKTQESPIRRNGTPERITDTGSFDGSLTVTGALLGTPAYMSPEQHRGSGVDSRTDQFSYCVALWEALCNEPPFKGKSVIELSERVHAGMGSLTPAAKALPRHIRKALLRGLQAKADERHANMEELIRALSSNPSRRRREVALAVVFLASVSGVFTLQHLQNQDRCDNDFPRVEEIWNPAVRERLREAFISTKVPVAKEVWERTSERLDRYISNWKGLNNQACVAAFVEERETPDTYARRMLCLDERLTDFGQHVSMLGETTTKDTLERAIEATTTLPQLNACSNEASSLADPADLDPEQRARLEKADQVFARAKSAWSLAEYEKGLGLANEASRMMEELGQEEKLGKSLLLAGILNTETKSFDKAETSLRRALRQADAVGDDNTRVRAWISLLKVVSIQKGDSQQLEQIAEDTRAAIKRLGNVPLLEADLHHQLGGVAKRQLKFTVARDHLEKALSIRKSVLGDSSMSVARALNNLGNVLLRTGERDEARKHFQQANEILIEIVGPNHPSVAVVYQNIGNALLSSSGRRFVGPNKSAVVADCKEAATVIREALAIRKKALTHENGSASFHHNLGDALFCTGQYKEALLEFQRAISIKEKIYKPTYHKRIKSESGLARVLLALDRPTEAHKLFSKLVASIERVEDVSPGALEPQLKGESYFGLALAWEKLDTGARRKVQEQALHSGRKAVAAFKKADGSYSTMLMEAEMWIKTHDSK